MLALQDYFNDPGPDTQRGAETALQNLKAELAQRESRNSVGAVQEISDHLVWLRDTTS